MEYVEPPEPAVTHPFGALDAEPPRRGDRLHGRCAERDRRKCGLVDLWPIAQSFGDPTSQLPQMLDAFTSWKDGGLDT